MKQLILILCLTNYFVFSQSPTEPDQFRTNFVELAKIERSIEVLRSQCLLINGFHPLDNSLLDGVSSQNLEADERVLYLRRALHILKVELDALAHYSRKSEDVHFEHVDNIESAVNLNQNRVDELRQAIAIGDYLFRIGNVILAVANLHASAQGRLEDVSDAAWDHIKRRVNLWRDFSDLLTIGNLVRNIAPDTLERMGLTRGQQSLMGRIGRFNSLLRQLHSMLNSPNYRSLRARTSMWNIVAIIVQEVYLLDLGGQREQLSLLERDLLEISRTHDAVRNLAVRWPEYTEQIESVIHEIQTTIDLLEVICRKLGTTAPVLARESFDLSDSFIEGVRRHQDNVFRLWNEQQTAEGIWENTQQAVQEGLSFVPRENHTRLGIYRNPEETNARLASTYYFYPNDIMHVVVHNFENSSSSENVIPRVMISSIAVGPVEESLDLQEIPSESGDHTVTLSVPTTPGSYKVDLVVGEVLSSVRFEVREAIYNLSLSKNSYEENERITCNYQIHRRLFPTGRNSAIIAFGYGRPEQTRKYSEFFDIMEEHEVTDNVGSVEFTARFGDHRPRNGRERTHFHILIFASNDVLKSEKRLVAYLSFPIFVSSNKGSSKVVSENLSASWPPIGNWSVTWEGEDSWVKRGFLTVKESKGGLSVSGFFGEKERPYHRATNIEVEAQQLTLQHYLGINSRWGCKSELQQVSPNRLEGTWAGSKTKKGREVWQRIIPKIKQTTFVSNQESDNLVRLTYRKHYWAAGVSRGNRPRFEVVIHGENLWGEHEVELSTGLEVRGVRYIKDENSKQIRNVVGLRFSIIVLPQAQPGEMYFKLGNQQVPFRFIVDNFPE